MEIRIAHIEDAKDIQKIYAYYVEKTNITFEYDIPSIEDMQKRITKTLREYPYIVAVENNHVIGYAYASSYQSRQAYHWDSELSIYIDQDYQSQGIATLLYQRLMGLLKMMNIQNLYACITYPNEKSQSFHQKFGFTLVGTFHRSGYKFNQWHDIIWLEKSIGNYGEVPSVIPFSLLKSAQIELRLSY